MPNATITASQFAQMRAIANSFNENPKGKNVTCTVTSATNTAPMLSLAQVANPYFQSGQEYNKMAASLLAQSKSSNVGNNNFTDSFSMLTFEHKPTKYTL